MKEIRISGCAPCLYPTDTFFGLLWFDDEKFSAIPKQIPYGGTWGIPSSDFITLEPLTTAPRKLSILWLSLIEKKYYFLETDLDQNKIAKEFSKYEDNTHIVVGMAPFGLCVIWVYGYTKSVIVGTYQAEPTDVDFKKMNPYDCNLSLEEFCSLLLKNKNADKLKLKNLSQKSIVKDWMRKYSYKYFIQFLSWKNDSWVDSEDSVEDIIFIEDFLFDGTLDRTHDGRLFTYHEGSTPKQINFSWRKGKSVSESFLLFDEYIILPIVQKFYGAHPETKVDFIIRIDAENKKYELALYRQGLKDPVVIPESAYQLIVFKNKFEDYRSENYNQPRGAWIW